MTRQSRSTAALAFAVFTATLFAGSTAASAANAYMDLDGANPGFGTFTGTIDWDSTANGGIWSASSTGVVATNPWNQGDFPRIGPAGTPTWTLTVSNQEQMPGFYFNTAQTTTVNAIGAGSLYITSGLQGVLAAANANVTINAPISGPGEIQPGGSSGGVIYLNGNNTYTGGTNLASTVVLTHFNNSSSFSTNFINMGIAGFAPLLGSGGAPITIPNNFTSSVNGAGINFAADANTPVTSTGSWTLGTNNLVLRNAAGPTSLVTISGPITGSGSVAISANNSGSAIKFSSTGNVITGQITVTGVGATGAGTGNARFILGAAGTVASSPNINLAGGILDPGGFNQAMTTTTLTLLSSTAGVSTIDFSAGASELDFANSSSIGWTGLLNLTNFDPNVDKLRFGIDATGLSSDQLSRFELNGVAVTPTLSASGFVVVPEPAAAMLLAPVVMLLVRRTRRA